MRRFLLFERGGGPRPHRLHFYTAQHLKAEKIPPGLEVEQRQIQKAPVRGRGQLVF